MYAMVKIAARFSLISGSFAAMFCIVIKNCAVMFAPGASVFSINMVRVQHSTGVRLAKLTAWAMALVIVFLLVVAGGLIPPGMNIY